MTLLIGASRDNVDSVWRDTAKPAAMGMIALGLWLCTDASAVPVVHEPGWTLIRTISFDSPASAVISSVDGRMYVGRREVAGDGLYRVDSLGFASLLAAGETSSGICVDPATGHIFHSEIVGGVIYRTLAGATGRQAWVAGFHSGDDDPVGMAIAPAGHSGGVVAPGEALVVDRGVNGADEIWRWNPASAEGETVVHADNGTLVDASDVAISATAVYVADTREANPGLIYSVGVGGTLTPLATSEPLVDPCGIVIDPVTGDLLVLDGGADRVARINPATGQVTTVVSGFLASVTYPDLDITADGRQLVVTANEEDAIFVFGRCGDGPDCDGDGTADFCELAAGQATDCNANGVPDACDVASGVSNDCNFDGVPDECAVCKSVEVVFIMDTSSSMDDEASALCGTVQQVQAHVSAAGLSLTSKRLSICDLPGGAYACLEDNVVTLLGTAVPGNPPAGQTTLGQCPGGNEVCTEDWARATSVVAGLYGWMPASTSVRVIIPISDEGSWCGDPVNVNDQGAIDHAITVALNAGVIVSPIVGTGGSAAVTALAQQLAAATGGQAFNSSAPSLDIADSIVDIVLTACANSSDCNRNRILDECDIASGTSLDGNRNGVPDECEIPPCPADIAPGPNGDGTVNVQDLLAVIGAWGPCANPADCAADIAPVGGNDVVNVQDLLAIIATWGPCP